MMMDITRHSAIIPSIAYVSHHHISYIIIEYIVILLAAMVHPHQVAIIMPPISSDGAPPAQVAYLKYQAILSGGLWVQVSNQGSTTATTASTNVPVYRTRTYGRTGDGGVAEMTRTVMNGTVRSPHATSISCSVLTIELPGARRAAAARKGQRPSFLSIAQNRAPPTPAHLFNLPAAACLLGAYLLETAPHLRGTVRYPSTNSRSLSKCCAKGAKPQLSTLVVERSCTRLMKVGQCASLYILAA